MIRPYFIHVRQNDDTYFKGLWLRDSGQTSRGKSVTFSMREYVSFPSLVTLGEIDLIIWSEKRQRESHLRNLRWKLPATQNWHWGIA